MVLQKPVHIFSQLTPNSFRRRDLCRAGFAQPIHRAKFPEKQTFPILAHAGAIIQNALGYATFHQELMVSVRKTVRLIANALEQSQCTGFMWDLQGQGISWSVNLFVFLGQPDNRQVVQPEPLQLSARS
jgi:hypothetical protein